MIIYIVSLRISKLIKIKDNARKRGLLHGCVYMCDIVDSLILKQ